ncbi:MAG: acetamidase/formamidase family protein [Clostridiaceae bacterium]|nr:acetamidase/formamidase family protein [Clostridiaceae bacterium]MBW4858525.1 acetamidase/formamidase family protein [Clostridiaceae bacterium]MBW4867773.1 acetamidase/formamidase family protein [Clostridiaceae bacterium]MBW4868037.1 acetamidase/formamidase family protein [Clostridiaceae bacterium]
MTGISNNHAIYVSSDNVIYSFEKGLNPSKHVTLPATLILETKDCFSGDIKTEKDTMAEVDYSTLNPSTGPIYFNNVKPGDVLEVKIKKIKCNSPGFTMCVPKEGLLGDMIKKPITKFYNFDNEKIEIDNTKVDLKPMIGVIGVAPAEGSIPTNTPGDHGGNIDTTLIKEGSTIFLPVFVDGGLLALGDLHAAMGDGESFFTGLEVSGEVEIEVKIRRDLKIDIPFVKSDDIFASIASEKEVHKSLKKAMVKMVDFITKNGDIDFYDAGFICGLCADLQISQVVDPLKTARMAIPTYILRQLNINL